MPTKEVVENNLNVAYHFNDLNKYSFITMFKWTLAVKAAAFLALEGAEGVEGVTGLGLMIGVKTVKPAKDVVAACMDNGVLCLTAKDKVRLVPALNIPMDELEKAITIANGKEITLDLAGYSLTDDADKERKFVIPSSVGVIEPRSFKIIFFDNNDLDSRQADFKLDCDGATLYLFSPEGGLLSSVEYGYSYPNLSYARKNDGVGSWATCITPTPGRSNDGSAFSVERLAAPEASVAAGVYKRGFVLKLTAPAGVTVRYTTDGSEPCENSKIWSGYMGVSSTTILRARSYKKGCIPTYCPRVYLSLTLFSQHSGKMVTHIEL